MNYWPQQRNFAVFCATQGCGISREIFDSRLTLPEQIRAFYKFHEYFKVRRILFQMGGIQSVSALPGDPTFNSSDNHFNVASHKRICAEFWIDPTSNFWFTSRKKPRPIACPAVLKRKLTIDPISPGRIEPTFESMSFRLFPIALPVAFRALVRVPTTAPIVTPAARNMAITITP